MKKRAVSSNNPLVDEILKTFLINIGKNSIFTEEDHNFLDKLIISDKITKIDKISEFIKNE